MKLYPNERINQKKIAYFIMILQKIFKQNPRFFSSHIKVAAFLAKSKTMPLYTDKIFQRKIMAL